MEHLGGGASARFAHLCLCALLLVGALHVWRAPLFSGVGERVHALSVLGLLLPEALVVDGRLSWIWSFGRPLYCALALLWALRIATPFTGWACVGVYTLVQSLSQETMFYSQHQPHVVNMLLLVLAAWHHFRAAELRGGRALAGLAGVACPGWVMALPVLYLCTGYTMAGVTKLLHSGVGWADGSSLQLWIVALGAWPGTGVGAGAGAHTLAALIVEHRGLAQGLQAITLWAEVLAGLALLHRVPSVVLGCLLIGFHLSIELLFGYGFWGNITADAIFLVMWPIVRDRVRAEMGPT